MWWRLAVVGIVLGVSGVRDARAGDPRLPFVTSCGRSADVGRSFLGLPSGAFVTGEPEVWRLATAAEGAGPVARLKRHLVGETPEGAWCVAERIVTVGGQKVAVITSGVGVMTGHGGDVFEDTMTVVARAVSNKELARRVKAGAAPRPPAIEAALARDAEEPAVVQLRAALDGRAGLAALWSPREDVVLAGSAPGELFQGARARSALRAWNLRLRLDGPVTTGTERGLVWVVANVEATAARAKGATPIYYRALFVLLADHAGADSPPDDETYHLVLAHFALVP